MLENAPQHMPRVMPMTAAVAPAFTARYPEIAIIFDNLHGMHDVISDILASSKVRRDEKRRMILGVAERYRDSLSYVSSRQEWIDMAGMMGVNNVGGPAVDFTPEFPAPTVKRGATMAEVMKAMGHDHGTSSSGQSAPTPTPPPPPPSETVPVPTPAPSQAAPARPKADSTATPRSA